MLGRATSSASAMPGFNGVITRASTTLDFDPETGDATADFAVFRLDPASQRTVESGAWYDAATGRITGAPRCP